MSTEMIRELNATEVDMVSGAFSFGGGFGLDGGVSGGFQAGIDFDNVNFGWGAEADLLGGITSAVGGILSGLFGAIFG
ncbi:MAG: hypothetical protein KUG81_00015 [Gammaproteobacteria bacterium]|nr:hypothetical protein [Gammaproteobacteria bacterium]